MSADKLNETPTVLPFTEEMRAIAELEWFQQAIGIDIRNKERAEHQCEKA